MNSDPNRLKLELMRCTARFRIWNDELKAAGLDKDEKKIHKVYAKYQQEKHKILTDWGIIPIENI